MRDRCCGKHDRKIVLAACALVVVVASSLTTSGCGWRATKVSSLHVSADREGSRKPSSFPPPATVYVIALVSNPRVKHKVKARVLYESVEGQAAGSEVPYSQKEFDLYENTRHATFPYEYAGGGWPKGTYRVEVSLHDEAGAQVDQRSDTFVVS